MSLSILKWDAHWYIYTYRLIVYHIQHNLRWLQCHLKDMTYTMRVTYLMMNKLHQRPGSRGPPIQILSLLFELDLKTRNQGLGLDITRGLSAWQLRCLIIHCLLYTAQGTHNDLDLTFQCHQSQMSQGKLKDHIWFTICVSCKIQ